ncbi:PREDICTED: proline-rich protein 1-like [Camelina sativa]|uniref:Proline-rich protein 1-like n=1 Tax=Camelina sativa TaxID=90675 RepID=A0ABM0Z6T4_CAMSA|nr:PREDICTED: proline-rich protein 1-like [Camelina sativa]
MAITSTSFAICLLLSLATIATADYYAPSSPPVYAKPIHKPTLSLPVYTPSVHKPTLPLPVYTPPPQKPTLTPPVYTKPTIPPPAYTPPVYTKPTLPPPVYTTPVYKSTLSPPVYSTKPTLPSPVYSPPFYKKSPNYSPPRSYVPKPTYTPPTKQYVPEIIKAVDGIILCKNSYKTYPIQGAKAKIVCSEMGSYGKSKNEVVIYSNPTDSKGYFHVALTHIKNLSHCRVKLYTSPIETCKNPTNVNKGLIGVPLSMNSDKNLKLFNVGPFYFTGSKTAPTTPKY